MCLYFHINYSSSNGHGIFIMKMHHPVMLEDGTERFLLTNGACFMGSRKVYYTGMNNNQVVLHVHEAGADLGESIFLDKSVVEFEAVHVLIDTLIEGMGSNPDRTISIFHRGETDEYILLVGHTQMGAALFIIDKKNRSVDEPTLLLLPYDKTGLEVATSLLKLIK